MLISTISAREHSTMDPIDETVNVSQSTTAIAQRTPSTLYQTHLPKDDIRLLTVLPSGELDAPVECEIHQFHTSTAPEYEGLSYVWGDPTDKTAVTCNGTGITVTTNFRNALGRIRNPSESKTVWVDALCLNQADVGEKNVHVPIMGHVYSQATNTVIFIGEASHHEAAAAEYGIMAISDMLDALRADMGIASDDFGDDFMAMLKDKVQELPRLDEAWSAVKTMFDAPCSSAYGVFRRSFWPAMRYGRHTPYMAMLDCSTVASIKSESACTRILEWTWAVHLALLAVHEPCLCRRAQGRQVHRAVRQCDCATIHPDVTNSHLLFIALRTRCPAVRRRACLRRLGMDFPIGTSLVYRRGLLREDQFITLLLYFLLQQHLQH